MKNLYILFFFIFAISCNEKTLELVTINQVKEVGSKNKGISKIIFKNNRDYLALFSNGSRMGSLSAKDNDYSFSDILGIELQACEDLCKNNEELSSININRYCSETRTSSMNSICLGYENNIMCECRNGVKKDFLRVISIPEEEKQRLIMSLDDITWIAQ